MSEREGRNLDFLHSLGDLVIFAQSVSMEEYVAILGGRVRALGLFTALQSQKTIPGTLAGMDKDGVLYMVASYIVYRTFGLTGRKVNFIGDSLSAREAYENLVDGADESNVAIIDEVFVDAWKLVYQSVFPDKDIVFWDEETIP